MRGAGRWLLSFAIIVMLSAWIGAAVAQTTIFNKQAVKDWLASSGTYDTALRSFFTLENSQGVATKEDFQTTFDATFPPSYIKQQTETALDATYDWIDGKKQTVDFSIPIQEKRDDFSNNLRKQIEPRIAALPQCPTRANPTADNPTCIPQGMKANELTDQLLRLSDDNDFLRQPITANTVAQSGQQLPSLSYLPMLSDLTGWLALTLPLAILLCATGYVLLSDNKLRGLGIISRRVFIHGLIFTVLGGLLWWFSRTLDLAATAQAPDIQQLTVIKNVVNPVFRIALPSIGHGLMFFGGSVAGVGGIAWLISFIIRRRRTRSSLLQAPVEKPTPTIPMRK